MLCMLLMFWCSVLASAQVQISVPEQPFRSGDKIDAAITNVGTSDVTFCVTFRNFGYVDHHVEEAFPSPMVLQQKGPQGWGALFTGYVTSPPPPQAVTLRSGESQHFPFRVHTHGTVRLDLTYGFGSNEHFCNDRANMSIAEASSREFSID